MFGAVDVYYPDSGGGRAALVVADEPRFAGLLGEHVVWLDTVAPYQAGHFFERELPAIASVLAQTAALDLLIVDGYVDLDPAGRPGLGAYVREAFGLAVIGVAKTAFRSATHAIEVRRGGSTRPLYVTAAGLAASTAADLVAAMAGPHRIPDALKHLDRLTRSG